MNTIVCIASPTYTEKYMKKNRNRNKYRDCEINKMSAEIKTRVV